MIASLAFLIQATTAAPATPTGRIGLLVVAHGATPEWNAKVRETVDQVRWRLGPLALAFLMGPEADTGGWRAGVARLSQHGATEIVVVPLMVSSAGGHYQQIRFLAGESDSLPAELAEHHHEGTPGRKVPMRVTGALDGAAELAQVLRDRWSSLPNEDRRRPLGFVAHGPTSDADAAVWLANLDRVVGPIAESAGRGYTVGLLRDDAPPPIRSQAIAKLRASILELAPAPGDSVVVMPILVSRGSITTVTIPRDLQGLPIRYTPVSLAPSAHLARWIERVALARLPGSH